MTYLGDYAEDYATLNFKFTTRDAQGTGIPPFTLAGTPVVSVYKGSGTSASTAGITLAVDFNSVTGLNNVLIDLSADAFYAIGEDYHAVITTGTVNSISVVGEVVGHFSIENRFIDANVVQWNGTAPNNLTANRVDCSVGNMAAGSITSVAFAIAAIDAAAIASNAIGSAEIATSALDAIRDALLDRVLSGNHDTSDTPGALLQVLTDAMSELAQAAPTATPTIAQALMLMYMALRNKLDVDASNKEIHNNTGTVIAKKALTDDGTTYSEAEMTSGP